MRAGSSPRTPGRFALHSSSAKHARCSTAPSRALFGIIVVSHDPVLNPDYTRDDQAFPRCGRAADRDASFLELQRYDVGRLRPGTKYAARFPDQQAVDGERIPRLADVFALARSRGDVGALQRRTKLSPDRPDLARRPRHCEGRGRCGARRRPGVAHDDQSFDWRTLSIVRRIAPEIVTVALTDQQPGDDTIQAGRPGRSPWLGGLDVDDFGGSVPKLVHASGARVWSPNYQDLDARLVKDARALGLAVVPWTVNEPRDMQRVLDLGVDGMISDRPDLLRSELEARGIAWRSAAHPMIGWLRPAPFAEPMPAGDVDPSYRRLRRRVFAGIFVGYAGYYLVRNNLALAIPDLLREHPEYTKAALGTALTGLSIAYVFRGSS